MKMYTDFCQEIVVDENSGVLDGHGRRGLGVDHFRLNKFADPEDGDYIAVSGQIKLMVGMKSPFLYMAYHQSVFHLDAF